MRGNFIYEKLGQQIARVRGNRKITQEEMAFRCGIDRTYLSRIEKGKANPSLKSLCKISKTLKTRLSRLLNVL